MGSAGDAMVAIPARIGGVGCPGSPSKARLQGPGDADRAIGEGSGVISTRDPTPGEETAEFGDREFTRDREWARRAQTSRLIF